MSVCSLDCWIVGLPPAGFPLSRVCLISSQFVCFFWVLSCIYGVAASSLIRLYDLVLLSEVRPFCTSSDINPPFICCCVTVIHVALRVSLFVHGPAQEVVVQQAAAIGNRCKSWRNITHAWVRCGLLSCERACFSPHQEACSCCLVRRHQFSLRDRPFSAPRRIHGALAVRSTEHSSGSQSDGASSHLTSFNLSRSRSSARSTIVPHLCIFADFT